MPPGEHESSSGRKGRRTLPGKKGGKGEKEKRKRGNLRLRPNSIQGKQNAEESANQEARQNIAGMVLVVYDAAASHNPDEGYLSCTCALLALQGVIIHYYLLPPTALAHEIHANYTT